MILNFSVLFLIILILICLLLSENNNLETFLYPSKPDPQDYLDPSIDTNDVVQNRDPDTPNPYILNNKINNTLKTMSCYNSRDYEPAIKPDGSYSCPSDSYLSNYAPNSPGQHIPCENNQDCHGFHSQLCVNNRCMQPFMGMNDFKNLPNTKYFTTPPIRLKSDP